MQIFLQFLANWASPKTGISSALLQGAYSCLFKLRQLSNGYNLPEPVYEIFI
jgi:hypothetical protein